MSMFSDVLEFHVAFELLVANSPSLPSEDIRALRRALLTEEVGELSEAEQANDIVEVADALADIIYIINGTLVSYGLGSKGDFVQLPNGIPGFPTEEVRANRISDINKHFAVYLEAESESDLGRISESLGNLTEAVYSCATMYNIPLSAIFREVHRTNMAKLVDGKVLRHPSGKVKKPDGWLPPNIHQILFPM